MSSRASLTLTVAAGVLALSGPAQSQSSDPAQGQSKSMVCVSCHGPSGISENPMFPHLAGQQASYLEIQLENFRTGERYHPLMTPVAQSLTDEDIADLAMYFSMLGPLAGAQP